MESKTEYEGKKKAADDLTAGLTTAAGLFVGATGTYDLAKKQVDDQETLITGTY